MGWQPLSKRPGRGYHVAFLLRDAEWGHCCSVCSDFEREFSYVVFGSHFSLKVQTTSFRVSIIELLKRRAVQRTKVCRSELAANDILRSFDVRGRSFNKALHWSDPLAFGRRAHFVTLSRPSSLAVDAVQLDDEGVYRCRVDFKNSPTRNFQIRLSVIVPPHQLLLYDEAGRDVAGVIGPLEEGGNFTLLCELRGGQS
ncbi:hypothetical protein EVAR_3911_1 [Eumeta japonica]|uniref:Ig-like domain-containing protein n=1 Tax=Eumeta variegata TaxID=151549 RepID=A0A4C1STL5_EUMVA|nr:hypothetical protein EVAR_3911_1 [Eumeta japonica]